MHQRETGGKLLRSRGPALATLGVIVFLLPACTDQDDVDRLSAQNAALQSEVDELTSEVSELKADLKSNAETRRQLRRCLNEERDALDLMALSVEQLMDPSAVIIPKSAFHPQACAMALKVGPLHELTARLAAVSQLFREETQRRLQALFNPLLGSGNTGSSGCNPNYGGCLKADVLDYDCLGGTGDGPLYTGTVQVLGVDIYDLDRDNDGWGCD